MSCPSILAVPTVPPGNVQAEATNSTTIRFTWNPPSPQFINGINQGYKVSMIPKTEQLVGETWSAFTNWLGSSSPKSRILIGSLPTVKIIFTVI